MAATTGRRADLYDAPAAQEMARTVNGVARRVSQKQQQRYRRDQGPSDYLEHAPVQPPAAPEVPRGPPISYKRPSDRDILVNQPDNSRSFSQRVKDRPFAREAFADDGAWDDYRDISAQKPPEPRLRQDGKPSLAVNTNSTGLAPRQTANDVRRRNSIQQTPASYSPPLDTIQSTSATAPSQSRHASRVPESKPRPARPISPSNRSSVIKETGEKGRKEWASDRSPLQKLEVKLNDISKEEKRARVEEAEMLLRESKAGRAHRRPKQEVTPTSAPAAAPGPAEEPGLVRSLSSKHRDNLHQSASTGSRQPEEKRQSGDGKGAFDYQEHQPTMNNTVLETLDSSRHPPHGKLIVPEDGQLHPAHESAKSLTKQNPSYDAPEPGTYEHPSEPKDNRQTLSTKEFPATRSFESSITRAVSMQHQGLHASVAENGEVHRANSSRESNSSHKAALAESSPIAAYETAMPTKVSRSNSRKLQKAQPAKYDRTNDENYGRGESVIAPATSTAKRHAHFRAEAGDVVDGRRIGQSQTGTPHQADAQQRDSQHSQEAVGLGLYESARADQHGPKRAHVAEETRQRQGQHGVSFKEPYERKPFNEWKRGEIAKLTVAELALDTGTDYESDNAWWESGGSRKNSKRSSGTKGATRASNDVINDRHAKCKPPLYFKCGPLLRYTGMRKAVGSLGNPSEEREIWRGSVMIVTQDSLSSYEGPPILRLFSQPKDLLPPPPGQVNELAPEYIDPIAGLTKMSRTGTVLYVKPVDHLEEEKDLSRIENDDGLFEDSPSPIYPAGQAPSYTKPPANKRTRGKDGEALRKFKEVKGVRLYADPARDVTFWRFKIEVELGEKEAHIAYRINKGPALGFWVPARGQSMNIMFHSCNGFSMSVNPDQFSGPDPLWRDVLNCHQTRPFHVMLGGGDQIYNDRVTVETEHFAKWINTKNPHEKHHTPFSTEMKEELETYYLDRYAMWFSQGLFGMANCHIPMVNIWDDHDIIDGFGSYPDHFMSNPVFMGLGEVAFKYYMLFQHQSVPEETSVDEPSWLLGRSPGPYIKQQSRSVFMQLGKHLAFLGLDCRTERKRDEILTDDTYDIIFERCRKEIVEGETKHLIVLLGVPVTYPRLVWLENILTSRAMDPIKALGRVGLFRGGFLNKFDGGVEILDDLDDHWTATHHKDERHNFVKDLQDLSAERSVRITLLGGDVHLAAIGQFYSNPKLKIPKDKDHRYMPNVVSSAIVNTPPPEIMADTLNKRNKVHHLDEYTDEDMIPMFTHDVDGNKRNNKRLLPRRNWCSIREYHPGSTPPPTPPESETASQSGSENEDMPSENPSAKPRRRFSISREDANPRKLFRRLSSRGAPPSSYRDDMNHNAPGGPASASNLPSRHDDSLTSFTPHRPSFDSGSQTQLRLQPGDNSVSYDPPSSTFSSSNNTPALRPIGNFQRRPTNLSEKAARKGDFRQGVRDVVNDFLNLEGGLDIILNCEVNQEDPAGITTPYRLLVPALWYDGSSDREKLEHGRHGSDEGAGAKRKPTLMKRLGLGRSKGGKAAEGQGVGYWSQGSESGTESYSGSETGEDEEEHEETPKKPGGGGPRKWFGRDRKGDEGRASGQWQRDLDQSAPPQRRGQQREFQPRLERSQGQAQPQAQPAAAQQQWQGGQVYEQGHSNSKFQSPLMQSARQPPAPAPSQPSYPRGYSGVEAYKEKPKRRWF